MLRLSHDQPSLWEAVLPPELFQMSEELAKVDKLLKDERFFAPFRERFYTRVGRPTIPTEMPFEFHLCLDSRERT